MSEIPKIGSIWAHPKTGNLYEVKAILNTLRNSNDHDYYPITVSYERICDGSLWGVPLHRWPGSKIEVQS